MLQRKWVVAMVLLLGACADVVAGDERSHPCASVADAMQRLACYDRSFPLAESALQEVQEQSRERFGLRAAPVEARPPGPDAVDATVVSVAPGTGGGRDVALDNGQVWRITDGDARGVLAAGDAVHVRKAALGSFMLVTSAGVPLRARRVR